MSKGLLLLAAIVCGSAKGQQRSDRNSEFPDSIATHKVLVDNQSRILSWIQPQAMAYDSVLRDRWNFIIRGVPPSPGPAPRSNYPQYYFYCAYKDQQMIPDTWMNDVGEKIPNWFESARLYYQYTGDRRPLDIVRDMSIYAIDHGSSAATAEWANFPFTTTNAGDTIFAGFTNAGVNNLVLHEVQVDHAGDMGRTYFRLFKLTGNPKFKDAAIAVANALVKHAKTGSDTASVWPYRVVTDDGRITAPYGANWIGCYELLDELSQAKLGNVSGYRASMQKAKAFILKYPIRTGYWTDGHTDTDIRSNTYKSNMSNSNTVLYLVDHPDFDPNAKTNIPALIAWTEKYFINRSARGEPSHQWGAGIVGEQDSFLVKMDYQTARYGAECARWFAMTGDTAYKEKAFRSLNWATYCTDTAGMAFESPLSHGVTSWWSDCYGEGPRMFYPAMAAVPEWAPPAQDHILYSASMLKDVVYGNKSLQYLPVDNSGIEYIRLSFKPSSITCGGKALSLKPIKTSGSYQLKKLPGDDDYSLVVSRNTGGLVVIK